MRLFTERIVWDGVIECANHDLDSDACPPLPLALSARRRYDPRGLQQLFGRPVVASCGGNGDGGGPGLDG